MMTAVAVGVMLARACAGVPHSGTAATRPASRAAGEESPAKAFRQGHIRIPETLLSDAVQENARDGRSGVAYTFGGDIRIGDLDGDGTVDFVLAKALGGMKTCYIAAFTWDGRVLWTWGDKNRRVASSDKPGESYTAQPPARPGPLLVADIDGDGRNEVVAVVLDSTTTKTSLWDMKGTTFLVLDGQTGQVKRSASVEPLSKADARGPSGQIEESNYVHQRLLAADFRGTAGPHDFVIKIGNSVIACDSDLRVLWTYENKFWEYGRHSSYIPCVGDMDGDGKDEVFGGNYVLDHDGRVVWERLMAEHNDSVAIVDWDGDPANGREGVLSGFGQVVNFRGDVLVRLGPEVVPHGQEVRCGPFLSDVPGLQMAVRFNGHRPDILIADRSGKVLTRFKLDRTPLNVGMETVRWDGPDHPDLLFSPPSLWDGKGRRVVSLADLPKPTGRGRMSWFHCIPADLEGRGRESVVLFDPCSNEVFIYGAQPLGRTPPRGYRHTSRQYNVRLTD
jgi:hypothetical protein